MDEQKNGKAANGRILIVDDDPNTLEILRRWLEREGYTTVSADNGAAAWRRCARRRSTSSCSTS